MNGLFSFSPTSPTTPRKGNCFSVRFTTFQESRWGGGGRKNKKLGTWEGSQGPCPPPQPGVYGQPGALLVSKGPVPSLAPTLDPRTLVGKDADLGAVLGLCYCVNELQGWLAEGSNPDQGTEAALRAGTWAEETWVSGRKGTEPLESDGSWEEGRDGGRERCWGLGAPWGQTWGDFRLSFTQAYPAAGGRRGSPGGSWKRWAGPGVPLGGYSTATSHAQKLQRCEPAESEMTGGHAEEVASLVVATGPWRLQGVSSCMARPQHWEAAVQHGDP